MQNEINTSAAIAATIVPAHAANAPSAKPETSVSQPIPTAETVAAITGADKAKRTALAASLAAKRAANLASGKPANAPSAKPVKTGAAKRVAAKPSKPATVTSVKPSKPTAAAREAARTAANDSRSLARSVAAGAVSAFYPGTSKPFKAASDTFSPINRSNAKPGPTGIGTPRQAALLLALVTYGGDNLKPSGHFVRGGFRVPAKLVNTNAKPGDTILAQPESGCLGNCLGLTVAFVSGPTDGPSQRDAVYRIDFAAARKLIQATHGDKLAAAFDKLTPRKPAKAA